MNTVTTINLAGTAFQLEDPAYAKLKAYLDSAKASLAGNPDAEEILADIERAIADKCRRFLSTHKNVITAAEADTIVSEMGPVASADGSAGAGEPAAAKPKRLYRIVEGEMIAGVANGLAVYFDIDVVLVRILFVLITALTGGGFVFGYLLAWIFLPVAQTAEQKAAASGAPFNAQEIIDRVKAEYAKIEERAPYWKKEWKDWKHNLKREKMRRAYARRERPSALGELVGIIVFSFFAWYGYHHFPAFHDFLDAAWGLFNRVVDTITNAVAKQ